MSRRRKANGEPQLEPFTTDMSGVRRLLGNCSRDKIYDLMREDRDFPMPIQARPNGPNLFSVPRIKAYLERRFDRAQAEHEARLKAAAVPAPVPLPAASPKRRRRHAAHEAEETAN